ncbi:hypothetical protein ABK040_014276 [Willaertia magna]
MLNRTFLLLVFLSMCFAFTFFINGVESAGICKLTKNTKRVKEFTCSSSISKKALGKKIKLNIKVKIHADIYKGAATITLYANNKKVYSKSKKVIELSSQPICNSPIKYARVCARFKGITLKKKKCFKCRLVVEGTVFKKKIKILEKKLQGGKC